MRMASRDRARRLSQSGLVLGWLALFALAASCSDDVEVGVNESRLGTGAAAGAGGEVAACVVTSCQGDIYACGDCVDNDGDGAIDALDFECLGPCDDTEDSFWGGFPGQNNAPCRQDCYFDQDSGPGNDRCYWDHRCDPFSTPEDFPPSGDARCRYDPATQVAGANQSCDELSSAQAPECLDTCLPLTPNGCDCFGCCELPAGSGRFVWIGSTQNGTGSCDAASAGDLTRCKPCTQVKSCLNTCEPCEVCVGRPATDPRNCADAGAGDAGEPARCPIGRAPCGQHGEATCSGGSYCITGCCVPIPA